MIQRFLPFRTVLPLNFFKNRTHFASIHHLFTQDHLTRIDQNPRRLKYSKTAPQASRQPRPQHPSLNPLNMSDDASYETFLTKANEDPNSGAREDTHTTSTSQARSKYDPSVTTTSPTGRPRRTSSTALPASLHDLPDTPFVSDTDSDWEPVFFNYAADTLPSLEEFKQVLRAKTGFGEQGASGQSVEELSEEEFDPRGAYKEIVERVRRAGEDAGSGARGNLEEGHKGVKIFRVEVSRTRVEYYVLTVGERKLVGVVAKAVES